MQAPGFHNLVSWAAVGITLCIVAKIFVAINARAASFISVGVTQKLYMGSNPGFLTANQVADAAITRIRNHGSHRLVGSIFMSFNQTQQLGGLVYRTGSGLHGGDDLMGIIYRSMSLIAQAAL